MDFKHLTKHNKQEKRKENFLCSFIIHSSFLSSFLFLSFKAPISWWSDFNNWMGCGAACGFSNAPEYVANGKKIPKDKFAPWLKEFLNDPTFGKFYTFDVSWDASVRKDME